ncbi:protoporphyrinogen oxidase [Antrihabitans sp. YC2-6]|uniref:protoporphyrinogen oxidase n=1 Tax=Antrihabitans sp. YC2-6 TaxID=2799498 RepID=UPI0018F38C06|nr:protoporphyrinogen oxidase [Antrihabitans sp. YC2-6]MBJ8345100.1 protoporphyrinogen oxidase [Antrihabitans sp. YC2-6]
MRFAVVGGGISGLVAAYRLRQRFADAEITILEASDRVGGKLWTVPLAGGDIDIGAEAFVGRRPEVPALLTELGLAEQLVHPSGARPLVWAGGELHPLPAGTLMGIPADADSVAGLVDESTRARVAAEPSVPLEWDRTADIDVGSLVADRFGEQVVRRSVDPLLGGVYAGLSSSIGVRAALPTLAAALDNGAASLTAAVRQALPPPSTAPVFGGIRDGYGVLLDALVRAARADVRLDSPVTDMSAVSGFDGVILALPAWALATLLPDLAPETAAIEHSTSALVALALPPDTALPGNSGILVASGESLRAKAFTLSSRKWPHLARRQVLIVRASFGRAGENMDHWTERDLIDAARADLERVTGTSIEPVDATVALWRNGLPQYGPGHLDRVAAIEAAVAELPGIEVAGAYLGGVGVPACVASGTAAAARLATEVAR